MLGTSALYLKLKEHGISCNEFVSMSNYTSMRVGGIASITAYVHNAEELITAIKEAKNHYVKHTVIGNGSNVIFSDNGFDGLVIITNEMKSCSVEGNIIKADCGASIAHVAIAAQKAGLTGLEFAYGIPGTIGGSVYMNAGAFGESMSDVVVSSICYDPQNNCIKKLDYDDHQFAYRESIYSKNSNLIILAVMINLKIGNMAGIITKMNQNLRKRKETQPLEYPSAGSIFKRPVGYYAGELIEKSGLKGYRIGDAEVSQKHAGFIINRGNATATDVINLIQHVKKTVFENYGVNLECEVQYIEN